MKILIFSAHPDDLETGMGGTVELLKDAGHEIISIVTTLPPFEKRYEGFGDIPAPEVRKAESNDAHALLGIKLVIIDFLGTELNFSVTSREREMFKEIITDVKPDVVFTHWGIDVNPDHCSLCTLSIEHCLQKGVNTELFCYEVFSEPGRPQSLGFYPTHYVDIKKTLDIKEKMVRVHKSQNPLLWEGCLEIQKTRGRECSVEHAEAFVRLTRYGGLTPELVPIFVPTMRNLPQGMGIKVNPKAIEL